MKLFVLLLILLSAVNAKDHFLYWNTTNPLWYSETPELTVELGDKIRIHCPNSLADESARYLIVYQVSELAHSECTLEHNIKQILRCTQENRRECLINISNRPSAHSSSSDYTAGNTYYWISTSPGFKNHEEQKKSGLCLTNNMRLKINVEENKATNSAPLQPIVNIPSGRNQKPRTSSSLEPINIEGNNERTKEGRFEDEPVPYLNNHPGVQNKASGSFSWEPVSSAYDEVVGPENGSPFLRLSEPRKHIDYTEEEESSIYDTPYPLESSSTVTQLLLVLPIIILI